MVSVSLLLRDEWYPIVAAVGAIVDALLGFLKGLGFRRLLVPAGPEERVVTFFQLAPMIHHAGYIGPRGNHLVDLAVAPRRPRIPSPAWGRAGAISHPVLAEVLALDRPWGPPEIAWHA